MSIKISIIIPVYNTGEILRRTINNVLNQTMRDFELILVNDGSTDNSLSICNEYSKKDSRIVVINKKNSGICNSRNRGIKEAKGEYIAFLDHDDEVDCHLLEDNYILAKKYNADIVKFGYEYIYCLKNKYIRKKSSNKIDNLLVLDKNKIMNTYMNLNKNRILVYIWDGLYKKSFLESNKILFDSRYTVGREDIAFNILCYMHVSKLIFNPKVYYKYYAYEISTYNGMKKEKYIQYCEDVLANFQLEKILLKKIICLDGYYEYRYLKQVMEIIGFLLEHVNNVSLKEIQYYLNIFSKKHIIKKDILKKGFKWLNTKQKIFLILFYLKKNLAIAILIKLYALLIK